MAKALVDRARTTCKSNYHILKQQKVTCMKNTLIALAMVGAMTATAAHAGTITGEVRFADVRGGQAPDSTEYKVEYTAPLNSLLNYGAELQVKQANGEGALDSKVSARVGPRLPDLLGFHSEAYGEVGQNLKQGANFVFWGAGAKTKRTLYGPVAVTAGYRHREAFEGTERLTENRLDAGLALDIGSGNSVGAKYYRTTGTSRSDAIGVNVSHTF